jgi:hypothetical protein
VILSSTFSRHHTVPFPHDLNAHLEGAPLLALRKVLFAFRAKDQINAAVGPGAARLFHLKIAPRDPR